LKLEQLDIERLEPSCSNKSTYVLLLREIGGDRKLPIAIDPALHGPITIGSFRSPPISLNKRT
jgi:hypothetical protein